MSFFKLAENLLNNLDQTTQSSINSALHKPQTDDQNKSTKKQNKKNQENNQSSLLTNSQSSSSLSTNNTLVANKNSSAKNSSHSLTNSWHPKANPSSKDDELINFLNNTDLSDLSEPLSKANSKIDLEKTDNLDVNNELNEEKVQFLIGDKAKQSETEDEQTNENTVKINENNSKKDQDEKKFLKNEVNSLNQEVQSLLKRIKQTEDEFQRSKRKIEHFQSQISQSDKIIRELRAREEDLNESIKSKDVQLGVFRVRFDEIESELKSKKAEIEILKSESDRILKDHSNSSDLQSQVLETLKDKLNDLEVNLQREKEAYSIAQKEHMSTQNRLEHEKQNLIESLQSIEKKLNEEKNKNNELNSQLKNSKTSLNFLKQEYEEYKLKASKTLQAKERLIVTLKESASGSNSGDLSSENSNGLNIKSIEIDELKMERDSLKEDLASKTAAIELLRSELMELESHSLMETELLKDQIRNIQDQYEESKQSKEYLDQDIKSIRQQLDYAQDELYKQKTSLNSRLQERETEIEKLRTQLTTKSLGTTTEKELENRLHLLTENLIQKQTLIEALQSEKHSIFLQLERSEKRLHDYESIVSSKKNSTSIRMHDDDESNKLPYLRESPYDHEVTRKMKRAASEIDKFSIRLGVFLKRYPIARIFVIFYMFLLHLWVVIVLFTYKPEVHDLSFHASALPQQPR